MKEPQEYLLQKALAFKHTGDIGHFLDNLSEEELAKLPVKNVCAKLSISLVNNLESACAVLSISKQKFIENAIVSYLMDFNEITDKYDIFRYDEEPTKNPRLKEGDEIE